MTHNIAKRRKGITVIYYSVECAEPGCRVFTYKWTHAGQRCPSCGGDNRPRPDQMVEENVTTTLSSH